MADETWEIATPLNDPCDSVTIGKGKHIKYYNPDTKRYRIFGNKCFVKVWTGADYYKIAKGNNDVVASIFYLLCSINYDSAITRYDSHLKARVQIRSREELADIIHVKYTSSSGRAKIKALFDLNIVFEAKVKLNDNPTFRVYYLNPLIGMRNKGISLDCYIAFRDKLKNMLTAREISNMDRHVLELYDSIPKVVPEYPSETDVDFEPDFENNVSENRHPKNAHEPA